ncbi:DUF1883 domain-containing protein [Sporomusa sp. KB1]|jgi:hypothetical protein|uniref:DUF1883 domain-containing protein n=1 Tax=Sporomusa sp. KB1 TaxID=943346 RepID=UPI0011A0CAEB|nr:DUF1883 domain-containing protein [Sporomusa sp. KB1]TWH48537.1 uncharacterized protein DUF1883 [Sporomusa sp. KB1]
MDFVHYDLGHKSGGEIVTVTIDAQSNVLLLDNINFSNYKQRRQFKYWGGLQKQSPVRLQIPHADRWNIVIDLGGRSGSIRSSCNCT